MRPVMCRPRAEVWIFHHRVRAFDMPRRRSPSSGSVTGDHDCGGSASTTLLESAVGVALFAVVLRVYSSTAYQSVAGPRCQPHDHLAPTWFRLSSPHPAIMISIYPHIQATPSTDRRGQWGAHHCSLSRRGGTPSRLPALHDACIW